jgi:hypothetical protein
MSYFTLKNESTKYIQKSDAFSIDIFPDISKRFSTKYIILKNSRDPAEEHLLNELNTDCSALYTVFKGHFSFIIHDKENQIIELNEKEAIYIKHGTKYEIIGDGEIQLINLPAYTEETYLHPDK